MATVRFTRSRVLNVNNASGTQTVDYELPEGKELSIIELFASTDTSLQKIEILYSEDGGSTWSNPWDENADHILQLWLGAGVPASGKPDATWFVGGDNHLIRVKITNLHPLNNSNVYFLVKGFERDVE